jgi:hypothetical protein
MAARNVEQSGQVAGRGDRSAMNLHGSELQLLPSRYLPLELERRTHVETACAAYHLNRKPQTMRVWASTEKGPIRPIRINGRLAWSVADLRRLLRVE